VGSLFGRETELARGRAVLDSAAREQIVRAIRVVGASGVGKTALAETLAAEAGANGWLVVWAPSFRIHAALSLFAARRVLQALLDARAERYPSGLTIDRERPEDFEETFLRIIEGVTLDHRLLLVLDDAQWTDRESRELIERTATALADRAIVILSAERTDESGPALSLADQAIALDDLPLNAAIEIVRSIYPGVSDEVATGIAAETRGLPADIVAVATAARDNRATTLRDVSASTRRVVARDLSLLDARVREFLQLCAIIDDPIELTLLEQLWPREEIFAMIRLLSGRYLVASASALRFVHSSVMESVLETIPIEIPLRQRVIDALKRLPSPRLEDFERLAKQCAAIGDKPGEREALIKLSAVAAAKSMLSLSASALERALAIASPMTEEIVPTYERLSQLYNGMGREPDAIRICKRGLAEAEAAGITTGIGALAASIAVGQCHSGFVHEALATIARYEDVVSEKERANLFAVGELIAMHRADVKGAADFRLRFEQCAGGAAPVVMIRHHVTNALLAIRLGAEQEALEHIKRADAATEGAPAIFGVMPLAAKMYSTFVFRGVTPAEQFIAGLGYESRPPLAVAFQANLMIARGEFADVEELLADKLSTSSDSSIRRMLMSARYTAAAFGYRGAAELAWQPAHQEVAAFEAGERAPTLLPIVVAALTPLATQSNARAKRLLDKVIEVLREPFDIQVFSYPELLALVARSLDAKDALESIFAGALWTDEMPWNRGHAALARGLAAAALGRPERKQFLDEARERFTTLGATFFADLAEKAIGESTPVARDARTRPNNTTRREVEIAGLVADGLSNREIAERLVLSERTVEGHIANLFAKVNVNSRTQLATWFMRSSSVAS
jgi:DNA-binding CsgD family transcriptional regulator/tetratricopeptide (TPR) repeat protein